MKVKEDRYKTIEVTSSTKFEFLRGDSVVYVIMPVTGGGCADRNGENDRDHGLDHQ